MKSPNGAAQPHNEHGGNNRSDDANNGDGDANNGNGNAGIAAVSFPVFHRVLGRDHHVHADIPVPLLHAVPGGWASAIPTSAHALGRLPNVRQMCLDVLSAACSRAAPLCVCRGIRSKDRTGAGVLEYSRRNEAEVGKKRNGGV